MTGFSRSAVSNGRRLHQDRSIDGRKGAARRFRDLTVSLGADVGGFDSLSEADRGLVRTAAMLALRLEALQADMARGAIVDPDALIRLSSEARRALEMIRGRAPEPKSTTLADYLASRGTAS